MTVWVVVFDAWVINWIWDDSLNTWCSRWQLGSARLDDSLHSWIFTRIWDDSWNDSLGAQGGGGQVVFKVRPP